MGTYAKSPYVHRSSFRPLLDQSDITIEIPIPKLGDWYAEQTGDRSLCVLQDDGSEYCTCIYECGNGVWRSLDESKHDSWRYGNESSSWEWESGCKKYCHAGVCDGQD